MSKNGEKDEIEYGKNYGLGRRVRTPLFEKDLLMPSPDVMEAIAQSYFADEDKLNIACQYLSLLEEFENQDGIRQALYKINGNRAIQARSLRYAVQAHGGLYWPDEATKEEKKFLAKQFKNRGMDEQKDEENIPKR